MSEPKKLKIKAGNNYGKKKRLIVKNETKSDQGLKIKKPLPDLPETPDPFEQPQKSLKIKSSSGEHSQQPQKALRLNHPQANILNSRRKALRLNRPRASILSKPNNLPIKV